MGYANFNRAWTMKHRRTMATMCRKYLKKNGFKKIEVTGSWESGCGVVREEYVLLTVDGEYFVMGYVARFNLHDGSLVSVKPPRTSADNIIFFVPKISYVGL